MEKDFLKDEMVEENESLLENVKKLDREGERKVEKEEGKIGSSPRAEKLLESFKKEGRSLRKKKLKPELVRELKQVESSEDEQLKDADQKFLEMVEEAETMIESTMEVGEKDVRDSSR